MAEVQCSVKPTPTNSEPTTPAVVNAPAPAPPRRTHIVHNPYLTKPSSSSQHAMGMRSSSYYSSSSQLSVDDISAAGAGGGGGAAADSANNNNNNNGTTMTTTTTTSSAAASTEPSPSASFQQYHMMQQQQHQAHHHYQQDVGAYSSYGGGYSSYDHHHQQQQQYYYGGGGGGGGAADDSSSMMMMGLPPPPSYEESTGPASTSAPPSPVYNQPSSSSSALRNAFTSSLSSALATMPAGGGGGGGSTIIGGGPPAGTEVAINPKVRPLLPPKPQSRQVLERQQQQQQMEQQQQQLAEPTTNNNEHHYNQRDEQHREQWLDAQQQEQQHFTGGGGGGGGHQLYKDPTAAHNNSGESWEEGESREQRRRRTRCERKKRQRAAQRSSASGGGGGDSKIHSDYGEDEEEEHQGASSVETPLIETPHGKLSPLRPLFLSSQSSEQQAHDANNRVGPGFAMQWSQNDQHLHHQQQQQQQQQSQSSGGGKMIGSSKVYHVDFCDGQGSSGDDEDPALPHTSGGNSSNSSSIPGSRANTGGLGLGLHAFPPRSVSSHHLPTAHANTSTSGSSSSHGGDGEANPAAAALRLRAFEATLPTLQQQQQQQQQGEKEKQQQQSVASVVPSAAAAPENNSASSSQDRPNFLMLARQLKKDEEVVGQRTEQQQQRSPMQPLPKSQHARQKQQQQQQDQQQHAPLQLAAPKSQQKLQQQQQQQQQQQAKPQPQPEPPQPQPAPASKKKADKKSSAADWKVIGSAKANKAPAPATPVSSTSAQQQAAPGSVFSALVAKKQPHSGGGGGGGGGGAAVALKPRQESEEQQDSSETGTTSEKPAAESEKKDHDDDGESSSSTVSAPAPVPAVKKARSGIVSDSMLLAQLDAEEKEKEAAVKARREKKEQQQQLTTASAKKKGQQQKEAAIAAAAAAAAAASSSSSQQPRVPVPSRDVLIRASHLVDQLWAVATAAPATSGVVITAAPQAAQPVAHMLQQAHQHLLHPGTNNRHGGQQQQQQMQCSKQLLLQLSQATDGGKRKPTAGHFLVATLRDCIQRALKLVSARGGSGSSDSANSAAATAPQRLNALLEAEKILEATVVVVAAAPNTNNSNNNNNNDTEAADSVRLIEQQLAVTVLLAIADAHYDVMDFEGAKHFSDSAVTAARNVLQATKKRKSGGGKSKDGEEEEEERNSGKQLLLWSLMRIGKCYEAFVAPDDATRALNEAFALATELHDEYAIAAVTAHTATVLELVAHFADSFKLYRRARDLAANEANAPALALDAEINFGVALLSSGKLRAAVSHLGRFVPLAEQEAAQHRGDHSTLSRALANLGHAKLLLGDTAGARDAQEREVANALRFDDVFGATTALNALANVQRLAGDYRAALATHMREMDLATNGSGLAAVQQQITQLEQQQQQQNNQQNPPPPNRLQECLCNIATCQRDLGQMTKARSSYEKALVLAKGASDFVTQARCLVGLGFLDLQQHRYNVQKNISSSNSDDASSNSKSLPAEACIKFCQAIRAAESLTAQSKSNNNRNPEDGGGDNYDADDDSSSPQTESYMIKASCCEVEWRVFDGLEQAYLLQQRPEEALLWADRKRMSHLSNMLRRLSAGGKKNTSSPLRRMESSVGDVMARAGVDIMVAYSLQWDDTTDAQVYLVTRSSSSSSSATVICRPLKLEPTLLALLTAQQSKFHRLVSDGISDTPLVPQLLSQAAEQESERLLRPADSKSTSSAAAAAAVSPLSALMFPVTAEMELSDVQTMVDTGNCRGNKSSSSEEKADDIDWQLLLSQLSSSLLGPIAAELREAVVSFSSCADDDVPTLCVVPDGFLNNVPFHALHFPQQQQPSDQKQQHLIDVAAVTVSPSIELLHHLSSSSSSRNKHAPFSVSTTTLTTSPADEKTADVIVALQAEGSEEVETMLRDALFASPSSSQQQHRLMTLDVPLAFDMREDFSGSLDLSTCVAPESRKMSPILGAPERLLLPAEWIASRGRCKSARDFSMWIAQQEQQSTPTTMSSSSSSNNNNSSTTLWLSTETDFTYRVVHETCVPVTRTFFLAGYPRLVSTLWRGPEFEVMDREIRSGKWLLPSSSSSSSKSDKETPSSSSVARSFRLAILDLRANQGVSLRSWAALRLIGLA